MTEVTTLENLLPAPHFSERHERHLAAPGAAVWPALYELRLGDLRLSRTLMEVRDLPSRLLMRPRTAMLSGRFFEDGPVPLLSVDPERLVVVGGVMQPWKLFGGDEPPELDAEALRSFDEPGWVKVGMDFALEPLGAGTRLRTETRVVATDPTTRRRFRLYWSLIRAGSGLIRRDLLRAVDQKTGTSVGATP